MAKLQGGMARVKLRPIRIEDAEVCLRWVSNPEVARFLGLVNPVHTIEQERSWIANILADKQHQRGFIIQNERGVSIGTCGLRGIDYERNTALLGIMIGDPRQWDRGYGTAATRALLKYGFEHFELREIQLSCHPENERAIRCYQKAGLRICPAEFGQRTRGRKDVRMTISCDDWKRDGVAAEEPTGQRIGKHADKEGSKIGGG